MENNLFLDFTHNCVFCKRNEILPKINVEQKMKDYVKNKIIQSKEKDAIAIQNIAHCMKNYFDENEPIPVTQSKVRWLETTTNVYGKYFPININYIYLEKEYTVKVFIGSKRLGIELETGNPTFCLIEEYELERLKNTVKYRFPQIESIVESIKNKL